MQKMPHVKDIVLVGGGHTHALVIRMWAMNPHSGLRLTLISPQVHTPYSGMLPGFIAGHYSFERIHIDLQKLCAWAGVRFIQAYATAINAEAHTISLKSRPGIEYDVCSIDIGSVPNNSIKGSDEFAVPVKPISEFSRHWADLQRQLLDHKDLAPFKVVIIGGGAGGMELITAMRYWSKKNNCLAEFSILTRGPKLLEHYPRPLQKKLLQYLNDNKIHYKLNFDAQAITQHFILSNTDQVAYDKVFYCTQARAASWLKSSDLDLNEHGFINVNDHLQSVSHKDIFAAGDIAHQINNPRPKAGVYAVRMAPTLFDNLVNTALRLPLTKFGPQKNFMSLLALGDKFAIGSRKPFSFNGKWVWMLKDAIDNKFMNLFHELPVISMSNSKDSVMHSTLQDELEIKSITEINMRCGGCGGKVGASVLSEVLKNLKPFPQADVLIGLANPDDAAVLSIPHDQKLVQSLDHLKTFIDDPYIFGKLSTLHALNDIFAMNAKPQSAQALVQLPLASDAIQRRDMSQLMQGAVEVLNQHECSLVGGHTSEDSHLNLGFCINALAQEEDLFRKRGCSKGQVLILTQSLGVGALFAAHMRGLAKGVDIENALNTMLWSNQMAARIFSHYDASACTDVTGFGLLGHLVEMLKGNNVGAIIEMDNVKALAGVIDIMRAGIFSSLQVKNVRLRRSIFNSHAYIDHPKYPLLFDPQTCGGLLASVDSDNVQACISELKKEGYHQSVIIGEVTELPESGLIKLK
ncbi:MAG: selenide,water dikinase [Flavobacteriales bacterium]